MKFRKNKKGIWLTMFSFFFLLFVLLYVLISINLQNREMLSDFKYVGARSLSLIDTYSEGQLELIYYDSLGRIIFPKSLFHLGTKGGFYEDNKCGSFAGYQIWINDTKECFPDYLSSLSFHFKKTMNQYGTKNKEIRHYFSYLGDGIFIASALDILTIKNENITYTIRPSFKLNLGYDMDLYEIAKKRSKNIVDGCMNVVDFETCVKEKLSHYSREFENLNWVEDCNKNEEKVFYSFVKQYEDCVNSIKEGCYCNLNLNIFKGYVEESEMKITLKNNGEIILDHFHHQFENNPAIFGSIDSYRYPDEVYILLKYNPEGELTHLHITDDEDIDFSQLNRAHTNLDLFIYKTLPVNYNIYSEKVLVNNVNQIERCGTFTRYARICIEQSSEFLIYDFDNDRLKETKIPLKFAIYVPDEIPPDHVSFNVINKPDDKKSLLLIFNRSEEEDISHYNLYLENSSFNNLDGLEPYDFIEEKYLFGRTQEITIPVEKDETLYYVTLTPVDVFGNENKENIIVLERMSRNDIPSMPIQLNNVNVKFDPSVSEEEKNKLIILDGGTGKIIGDD